MIPTPRSPACRLLLLAAFIAGCGAPGNAVNTGRGAAPQANSALSSNAQALDEVGDTFIFSRLDDRRCASPVCGGYFVKLVNQPVTPCADGTSAADCHALRLDFSASGLSAADAARFEQNSFVTMTGLVQGTLYRRPPDPDAAASAQDVLLVSSAWQGQALAAPKGSWGHIVPTGKLCVTYPCDSFEGDRLNTYTVRNYNAVALAASGAPADAVARGNLALANAGVIAAGVELLVSGPAGRSKDFSATEFYLHVTPCTAQDAHGVGTCAQAIGYRWDGVGCVAVSGCSCTGAACATLSGSLAACKSEHAICSAGCGQPGRQICGAKQYCDFPDAYACGAAAQPGDCRARPEVCTAISRPACGCDGKTYANPCEAHLAGVDVATLAACK